MNRFESMLNLEKLQAALTVVVGNDIIIPHITQCEDILASSVMYGYIWRYKNCSVMVDYGRIASATIYQNNELDMNIETIRAYVKGELYRLMSQEVKANAM